MSQEGCLIPDRLLLLHDQIITMKVNFRGRGSVLLIAGRAIVSPEALVITRTEHGFTQEFTFLREIYPNNKFIITSSKTHDGYFISIQL